MAVIVFLLLSLLIVLGHYLTHEAKGSDDAPDADTAIINAEGGQAGGDDKKEYFILVPGTGGWTDGRTDKRDGGTESRERPAEM